ncbi:MAG: hypothetical protein ACTIJ9_16210 [Aequorivita sp.]
MKTINLLLIALAFSALIGCGNNQKQDKNENSKVSVAEKENIHLLTDESDLRFAAGLKFMENKQNSEAAKSLKDGIVALKEEAKDVTGKAKKNIDTSVDQLDKLVSQLEKGNNVPMYKVRELIANAKINAKYNYLTADDVYVTEDPHSIETDATHKRFNTALANLKKEEGNVKADAKNDHEALISEGEKLKNDYDSWNNRTKEYNRKTNEYFKRHYPEYYMEKMGVYPNY